MSSYKGRQNAKAVELDFPHFVDITRHGIKPQRGHGRHDANGSVIRWCFAEAELANNFAREFSVS